MYVACARVTTCWIVGLGSNWVNVLEVEMPVTDEGGDGFGGAMTGCRRGLPGCCTQNIWNVSAPCFCLYTSSQMYVACARVTTCWIVGLDSNWVNVLEVEMPVTDEGGDRFGGAMTGCRGGLPGCCTQCIGYERWCFDLPKTMKGWKLNGNTTEVQILGASPATRPEAVQYWVISYLALNIFWLISIVPLIMGIASRKSVMLLPWIFVTSAVCAADVAATAVFASDLARPIRNYNQNLRTSSEPFFGNRLAAAMFLPLVFARGVTFWVGNVLCVCAVWKVVQRVKQGKPLTDADRLAATFAVDDKRSSSYSRRVLEMQARPSSATMLNSTPSSNDPRANTKSQQVYLSSFNQNRYRSSTLANYEDASTLRASEKALIKLKNRRSMPPCSEIVINVDPQQSTLTTGRSRLSNAAVSTPNLVDATKEFDFRRYGGSTGTMIRHPDDPLPTIQRQRRMSDSSSCGSHYSLDRRGFSTKRIHRVADTTYNSPPTLFSSIPPTTTITTAAEATNNSPLRDTQVFKPFPSSNGIPGYSLWSPDEPVNLSGFMRADASHLHHQITSASSPLQQDMIISLYTPPWDALRGSRTFSVSTDISNLYEEIPGEDWVLPSGRRMRHYSNEDLPGYLEGVGHRREMTNNKDSSLLLADTGILPSMVLTEEQEDVVNNSRNRTLSRIEEYSDGDEV
ncbi:unnamed protein product [Notodromas monacha]|uniref:Uncharacterized protein n=1 Tax=Notodromas monacha TaxID=399045 RepID=A0A7R9GCB2_9CRUS|nr:unnamed protein product [Notodromas monacha]CAG0917285.1 unnamed protein product [Notodromas monacha]